MNDLARVISDFNNRIKALEAANAAQQRSFGLPGFKHAFIASVPIELPANAKDPVSVTLPISVAGPFVLCAYSAAMLQDGRWRPVSSLVDTAEPPLVNSIDFLYELEVDGTSYKLQNKPIGSPFLFSNKDRPRYLPQEFLLDGDDSITITITPTVEPPEDIKLYFTVYGYKILGLDAMGHIGKGAPSLEQIPGYRKPWTASIDVKIAKGQALGLLSANDRSYTQGATGIFVVTALGATWRVTTAAVDDFGRFRHTSSMQDPAAVPAENAIDFLWSATNGTDLRWTGPYSTPVIPSASLFTNQERPLYLPAPMIIAPGSIVTLDMNLLQVGGSEGGVFQFIMDGYLIDQGTAFRQG